MKDKIRKSLQRLFEEHRIVFWYDTANEMRSEYEALELQGVTKVEIDNNEFGLKYRMLREEPKQKFLAFYGGPEPDTKDNWLLDLQLAHTVFKADQAAIWLAELGLPAQFEDVVRDHMEFYRSKHRFEHLKRLTTSSDTKADVQRRMLAACTGADGPLDTVIEELLGEMAEDRDDAMRLISRSGLTDFFWTQVENAYGYTSSELDFEDFVITLFQSAYRRTLGEDGALNADALLMFRRWKNSRHRADAYEVLSRRYEKVLKISEDLATREYRDLLEVDYFEEVDRLIIKSMVSAMAEQALSFEDVNKAVKARKQSYWYSSFEDIYMALHHAANFHQALASLDLSISSSEDAVRRYTTSWYKLDQAYRKFISHMQRSGQASLLSALFETVENLYSTKFLLAVNDAWQDQIEKLSTWSIPRFPRQANFYRDQVADFRKRDQKVVVVISDALRYEVAEECLREIRKKNGFDAELTPMIGALPSYTQLGMAALLPNEDLTITEDGSVTSFGQPTQGTVNREKLLNRSRGEGREKAMKAEDFMALKADEGRQIFRDHDVLYLFHNRIDVVGDKLATEERVPEAVENAVSDLTKLAQKLKTANYSNIFITADHGFLYQHRPLDESEFSIAAPEGNEILMKTRRYVIGRGLKETAGMKRFEAHNLGLSGDIEVLLPNSINRMRAKGSGSRFVHGGASLQEIIVPLMRVSKQREADVGNVDVDIIREGRSLITSGQTAVRFFQKQAVSEKLHERYLIAGIYADDGTLLSDEHELTFDFASSNPREREMQLKFLLSREADKFNNQDVFVKLRERVGRTRHYEDYDVLRLQLRRGITTDFDF